MTKTKFQKNLSLVVWLILLTLVPGAFAQSAGTDTIEEGRTYYEANVWTGTQSHENGGMQVYGGRFAYGLTKKMEVGFGASYGSPNDPEYPPEIQPSVKYKFYENENYGITAAGGAIGFVPVAKRAGTDAFVMIYSNISKDVDKLNGARFTAGVYALAGRNKEFGSRKGWNFMYEQPVTEKVSFSTQWTTGNNRFGYLTPGLNVNVTKNSSLYVGYSIGNNGYDNHGPYISYSLIR